MTQVVTFTPEAVKDVLLAAGFTESDPHTGRGGFYVKPWPSTIFVTWDARPPGGMHPPTLTQKESMHGDYRNALRQAGFRVAVQAGCVPVTGLQERADR